MTFSVWFTKEDDKNNRFMNADVLSGLNVLKNNKELEKFLGPIMSLVGAIKTGLKHKSDCILVDAHDEFLSAMREGLVYQETEDLVHHLLTADKNPHSAEIVENITSTPAWDNEKKAAFILYPTLTAAHHAIKDITDIISQDDLSDPDDIYAMIVEREDFYEILCHATDLNMRVVNYLHERHNQNAMDIVKNISNLSITDLDARFKENREIMSEIAGLGAYVMTHKIELSINEDFIKEQEKGSFIKLFNNMASAHLDSSLGGIAIEKLKYDDKSITVMLDGTSPRLLKKTKNSVETFFKTFAEEAYGTGLTLSEDILNTASVNQIHYSIAASRDHWMNAPIPQASERINEFEKNMEAERKEIAANKDKGVSLDM